MADLQTFKFFCNLGISAEALTTLAQAGFKQIDDEDNETKMLVATIKNQTAEKKAGRDFYQQLDQLDT